MLSPASPIYIDGVKQLHQQLDSAYIKAFHIASKFLPLPISEFNRTIDNHSFRIFVETSQNEMDSKVKGFFIFGHFICRFLPILIEPAALFPVVDFSGWDDKSKRLGIELGDIRLGFIDNSVLFFSSKKDSRVSFPLFNISIQDSHFSKDEEPFKKFDDVGLPFYINDVTCLNTSELPNKFLCAKYSLIGKDKFAPYANFKRNQFCVLYAELINADNKFPIKVLRWFPQTKTEVFKFTSEAYKADTSLLRVRRSIIKLTDLMIDLTGKIDHSDPALLSYKEKEKSLIKTLNKSLFKGDTFFELGYIAESQSKELYQYMVNNDSRLLFAKIVDDSISIIGNATIFFNSEYMFPLSLKNIRFI